MVEPVCLDNNAKCGRLRRKQRWWRRSEPCCSRNRCLYNVQ